MEALVQVNNNQVVTNSRVVAENFSKRHDHVLRDIESFKKDVPNFGEMFHEAEIPDSYGRPQRVYFINKKGFQLLAMGFTGRSALEWKLKYIDAFESMEKQLAVPKLTPNPHYRSRMIKTAVRDIGGTAEAIAEVFGVKKGMATAAALQMIGKAYGIDTEPLRTLLPAEALPGLLTPTGIAQALGIVNKKGTPDPIAVNRKLEELGLQKKVGKQWTLTESGLNYGEAKPYTNHGHSGYTINWHESIMELLRR